MELQIRCATTCATINWTANKRTVQTVIVIRPMTTYRESTPPYPLSHPLALLKEPGRENVPPDIVHNPYIMT